MTIQANKNHKVNRFKLSEQVKSILFKRGLLKAFNYSDYDFFKSQTVGAFNRALAIAELFINEREQESELNEYIF